MNDLKTNRPSLSLKKIARLFPTGQASHGKEATKGRITPWAPKGIRNTGAKQILLRSGLVYPL